ncbi:hypothetical protein AUJ61_03400 [Candidatus Pacearchaeota archaeon CG1_02_30_18]|nr:MAG: hypothetical protein AUJ61_03400 [Candidatus Pacearchaeota archaeon CG1_02_30_18]PIZ82107.1 MAG: hypothetical protein COX98_01100 [Candidatus Pacearchaeota archaeon CG_4_10_14_0_2_um_filter_30_11]
MLPKFHILIGLLFSIGCYTIFSFVSLIGAGLIFLSSVLIDFDHYIYYIFKKKSFSLKKAYNWFKKKGKQFSKIPKNKRKSYALNFSFFHGLEWVFIFSLFGKLFNNYFYFIAIGIFLHLVLDWIHSYHTMGRFFKISIIFDYFNNKNLKKIQLNFGRNKV